MMDYSKLKVHPDYIGGVLLVLVVISEICLYRYFLDDLLFDFDKDTLGFYTTAILAFIGAGILFFTKHRDVTKTLVVSGTIFALISLYEFFGDWIIAEYINYDTENFLEAVLRLAFAIMLLTNLILFITKRSANMTLMLYSLAGIFCMYIIRYLDLYRWPYIGVWDVLWDVAYDLPLLLLILFCILLLLSDTVKVNSVMYVLRDNYGSVRRVAVPTGVRIDRSEIANIENIIKKGMDCDRYEILLNSHYDSDYKIVLTKEESGLLLNFSYLGDETGIGMIRFFVKGITTDTGDVETCDTVRIYGEDMFFIQMIAGGPYVAPVETSLVDTVLSIFKKKGTDATEEGEEPSEEPAEEQTENTE